MFNKTKLIIQKLEALEAQNNLLHREMMARFEMQNVKIDTKFDALMLDLNAKFHTLIIRNDILNARIDGVVGGGGEA